MSGKKIAIGAKPTTKPTTTPTADTWVESRVLDAQSEEMKRLTIDIPASLHRAIKSQTGARGTKIADEVRELLMQKYGNTEIIK